MLNRISRAFDYFGYLFKSTDLHGIHSPFIFQLAEQTLYHKAEKRLESIEFQRTQMLESSKDFYGTPLGLFVATYTLPAKHSYFLNLLCAYLNIKHITEYGKCTGIETNYILHNQLIEENRWVDYKYIFEDTNPIKVLTNESWLNTYNTQHQVENDLEPLEKHWDLHLIHLNDNPQLAWQQFDKLVKTRHAKTIIAFTNIHFSDDHYVIWRQIANQDAVTVDIDLFRLGILFFRTEQPKESFLLRY